MKTILKHKLALGLSFISYCLGISRLFYWLNRKSKRIITFHNVMPIELLPKGKRIGIVDDCDSFRTIIREVTKRFKFSNDVNDTSTVTITFDDGYKNQVECAANILKEEGNIPAIIFASGQNINNTDCSKTLVVDLLLHWTYLAINGSYTINNQQFDLTSANRDFIWGEYIWPAFYKDSLTKGTAVLNELDAQYPMKVVLAQCSDEYLRLRLTGITEEDIANLKFQGIDIGWHSQSHFPLSRLSTSEKLMEIGCPYPEMKNLPFSYPYGENQSVDDESKNVVQQSGFPSAVSNIIYSGCIDKFFLPRISLSENKYFLHFELSGLKYFLQHRRLLKR